MSAGPIRRLAGQVGDLLGLVYPPGQSGWVRAMRCEIAQVEDDGAALAFALGCLWGGCREAAARRLSSTTKGFAMNLDTGRLGQPRTIGILCALAATCLGLVYLAAAGAPGRYLAVNAAAFLLGVAALAGLGRAPFEARRSAGWLLVPLGAGLLATALLGVSADGVTRWIRIGSLSVQPSQIVLPLMILVFARRPGAAGAAGIALAALALALQPDRAMSGVLALALAVIVVARPGRATAGALAVAVAAFAVALARPDGSVTAPFVDRILYTSFDVHPLAGAAVLLGALLLLVPAAAARRGDGGGDPVPLVFGAVWLGCIAAAALGNYPTPVVGYGGSAILGYLLSLSGLPAGAGAADRRGAAARDEAEGLTGMRREASPA